MKAAFTRVAQRSLAAADAVLAQAIQEKAGFLAYHAFESIGGAYCTARGVPYHPASHPRKLALFVQTAQQERFARVTARLAIEVTALRNLLLYPRRCSDGSVARPETVVTAAQARRLVGRVNSLVKQVERVL